jgi:hypothetical protein
MLVHAGAVVSARRIDVRIHRVTARPGAMHHYRPAITVHHLDCY